MPISGLVITLDANAALSITTLSALRADPRITCGVSKHRRVPIVTETRTLRESVELATAIQGLPGVTTVDVVSVDFSDAELAYGT